MMLYKKIYHVYVCTDVIGAFHEIGYTQLLPGARKLQVNLKLKDLT
jgi:hypothetical protein